MKYLKLYISRQLMIRAHPSYPAAIWISLTGRITSVTDFNDTGTSLPDRN